MHTGIENVVWDSESVTQPVSVRNISQYIASEIVGQSELIDRLLIALLCGGHLLLEGFPGLAKTRAVKTLAKYIEGSFHRIQFTPDLLPADLTGTDVYRPEKGIFEFRRGPLFHEIILADEINRAPAKVQSALLEAMEERQITVGSETYQLSDLFMVMATQNPIEHEGTYPLPEAQRDRFLMQVRVQYPEKSHEHEILKIARSEVFGAEVQDSVEVNPVTYRAIVAARREIYGLHMAPAVEQYIVELINATRDGGLYEPELGRLIDVGASPRGTIALDACARARAWLDERDYISPADVQQVAHDVLRHRILLTYEADAENIDTDDVIDRLLSVVAVP